MNRFSMFKDIYERYVRESDPPLKTQHDLLLPIAVYRLLTQRQLRQLLQRSQDTAKVMIVGGFNDSAEMIAMQSAFFNNGKAQDRAFEGHVLSLSQQDHGIGSKHPILEENVWIHSFMKFFTNENVPKPVSPPPVESQQTNESNSDDEWKIEDEKEETCEDSSSSKQNEHNAQTSPIKVDASVVFDPQVLLASAQMWIFGQAFSHFLRKRHQLNRNTPNEFNSFMLQFLRLFFTQIPEGCTVLFLDFPQDGSESLPWLYVQQALVGTTLYQSCNERFSFEIGQKRTVTLDAFVVAKPPSLCLSPRFYRILDQWGVNLKPKHRPINENDVPIVPRALLQGNRESIELDLVSLQQTMDFLGYLPGWRWKDNNTSVNPQMLMKRWMYLKWLEPQIQ